MMPQTMEVQVNLLDLPEVTAALDGAAAALVAKNDAIERCLSQFHADPETWGTCSDPLCVSLNDALTIQPVLRPKAPADADPE